MKLSDVENAARKIINESGVFTSFIKITLFYVVGGFILFILASLLYLAIDVSLLLLNGFAPDGLNYVKYTLKTNFLTIFGVTFWFYSFFLFIECVFGMAESSLLRDDITFLKSVISKLEKTVDILEKLSGSKEKFPRYSELLDRKVNIKNNKAFKSIVLPIVFSLFSIVVFSLLPKQIDNLKGVSNAEIDDLCVQIARRMIDENGDRLSEENFDYEYVKDQCQEETSKVLDAVRGHFPVHNNLKLAEPEKLEDVKDLIYLYTYVNIFGMETKSFCEEEVSITNKINENNDYSFGECLWELKQRAKVSSR